MGALQADRCLSFPARLTSGRWSRWQVLLHSRLPPHPIDSFDEGLQSICALYWRCALVVVYEPCIAGYAERVAETQDTLIDHAPIPADRYTLPSVIPCDPHCGTTGSPGAAFAADLGQVVSEAQRPELTHGQHGQRQGKLHVSLARECQLNHVVFLDSSHTPTCRFADGRRQRDGHSTDGPERHQEMGLGISRSAPLA